MPEMDFKRTSSSSSSRNGNWDGRDSHNNWDRDWDRGNRDRGGGRGNRDWDRNWPRQTNDWNNNNNRNWNWNKHYNYGYRYRPRRYNAPYYNTWWYPYWNQYFAPYINPIAQWFWPYPISGSPYPTTVVPGTYW